MKIYFKKNSIFKFLGLKLFELNTEYIERNSEKNSDDDDFYVELQNRIIDLKERK